MLELPPLGVRVIYLARLPLALLAATVMLVLGCVALVAGIIEVFCFALETGRVPKRSEGTRR